MLIPGKKPIQFKLKKDFKEKLKNKNINWGFGPYILFATF